MVGSFAIVHGCQSFRRTLLVLFSRFTDLDRRRHLETILGLTVLHERLNLAAIGVNVRPLSLSLVRESHHVVEKWVQVLVLVAGEQVQSNVARHGVPMLSDLQCRDLGNARGRGLVLRLTLLQLLRRFRA